MKRSVFALIAVLFTTSAAAASLIESKDYKEYYVDFDDRLSVVLTVQGEAYQAARPATLISIRKVADDLYVVDQENLYYPAVVVYPPLPVVTMQDSATEVITKEGYGYVRVLVPSNLDVEVEGLEDRQVCLAYWTGFVFDQMAGQCVEQGASGCTSPFRFQTLEACETAHGLR